MRALVLSALVVLAPACDSAENTPASIDAGTNDSAPSAPVKEDAATPEADADTDAGEDAGVDAAPVRPQDR